MIKNSRFDADSPSDPRATRPVAPIDAQAARESEKTAREQGDESAVDRLVRQSFERHGGSK